MHGVCASSVPRRRAYRHFLAPAADGAGKRQDAAQQEAELGWADQSSPKHARAGAPPPLLMQQAPANGSGAADGAAQCGIGLTMDIHHRTKAFFVASVKPGGAAGALALPSLPGSLHEGKAPPRRRVWGKA